MGFLPRRLTEDFIFSSLTLLSSSSFPIVLSADVLLFPACLSCRSDGQEVMSLRSGQSRFGRFVLILAFVKQPLDFRLAERSETGARGDGPPSTFLTGLAQPAGSARCSSSRRTTPRAHPVFWFAKFQRRVCFDGGARTLKGL